MEEKHLDFVLVPLGILIMAFYHGCLLWVIIRSPTSTVVGLNSLARQRWVKYMMDDPLRNGVLAVQTIRNNIMASTLLASTAITLSSLIGVVVSSTKDSASSLLIYGNTTQLASSVKYFTILVCFLSAFLFNVQSIRYYAHASFLISVPPPEDDKDWVDYIARSLNRGSYFWSLGLRAFYVSFPLFLWIFGPIPMFVCCCIMVSMLYFLDTTTSFSRQLHHFLGEDGKEMREGESEYSSA